MDLKYPDVFVHRVDLILILITSSLELLISAIFLMATRKSVFHHMIKINKDCIYGFSSFLGLIIIRVSYVTCTPYESPIEMKMRNTHLNDLI